MPAVTSALSFQEGGQLSEESGSEEDAPPIRRWLEAQHAADSEDTDEDGPGAAALATHSTAEALHSSAAPSGTLLEHEVQERSLMISTSVCSNCSISWTLDPRQ